MQRIQIRLGVAAMAAAVVLFAGCYSGPRYLSRSVDDTVNELYTDSPILTAVCSDIVPVVPLIDSVAFLGDWLILNPVQFWGSDVWHGEGAAYHHSNPPSQKEVLWSGLGSGSGYALKVR